MSFKLFILNDFISNLIRLGNITYKYIVRNKALYDYTNNYALVREHNIVHVSKSRHSSTKCFFIVR